MEGATTLSIKSIFETLGINDIQHNDIQSNRTSGIMLCVVAPLTSLSRHFPENPSCLSLFFKAFIAMENTLIMSRQISNQTLNDEDKSIRDQCYKTFYGRNLRIYVKQLEYLFLVNFSSLISLTNTSFVQKSVNHGQKSFITLVPGSNVLKLFTAVIYEVSLKAFPALSWCLWVRPGAYIRVQHSLR